MDTGKLATRILVALACVALFPLGATAQSQFSGSVTDNTGGVLPGVTVEATSPVLIEGARVAVTDGQGLFAIVNLRPGLFTLTFTLAGFSTQIRTEVILPADTTISLNIEMAVGAVEESITVSGESPVVDIQRVVDTQVITREILEAIPTGRSVYSFAALIPGIQTSEGFGGNRQDIAGNRNTNQQYIAGGGQSSLETGVFLEGLDVNSMRHDGATKQYMNPMQAAETTFTTTGMGAESGQSGIRINIIPRDGGNTLSGSFYAGGTQERLMSENFNETMGYMGIRGPEDNAQFGQPGLRSGTPKIDKVWDVNGAVGGPLVRDRLWYYTSYRDWGSNAIQQNALNRDGTPSIADSHANDILLRLTTQATARNKFAVSFDKIFRRRPHITGTDVDRETASTRQSSINRYTATAKYTSTISSRSLLEVGWSAVGAAFKSANQEGISQPVPTAFQQCLSTPCVPASLALADPAQFAGGDRWYSLLSRDDDRLGGLRYDARGTDARDLAYRQSMMASYSYVTGSHNIKVGFLNRWGKETLATITNGDISSVNYDSSPNPWGHTLSYVGASHPNANCDASGLNCGLLGRPESVTVRNTPTINERRVDFDYGVYATDSWTIDRLTLSFGMRMEGGRLSNPAVTKPGGRFTSATTFGELGADFFPQIGPQFAPRLSAAYDLFGDGKTALKAGWNRYYATFGFTWLLNLDSYAGGEGRTDTREWYDVTLMPGTDTPMGPADCELTAGACTNPFGTDGDNIAQDWEIGTPGNDLFAQGASRVICFEGLVPFDGRFTCEQDWKRKGDDVLTFGIQQELMPGVSVHFDWRRRWIRDEDAVISVNSVFDFQNGQVVDNDVWRLEETVLAPAPYTATIPIYGIFQSEEGGGTVDARIPKSANYIDQYSAIELGINARLPRGGTLFGAWHTATPGVISGSGVVNNCGRVVFEGDNPNSLRFCDEFSYARNWTHEFKLSGAYPLPWYDLQLAGSAQAYPGNGLQERFRFRRSSSQNSGVYGAPFYTEANCVSPCVLGGPIRQTPSNTGQFSTSSSSYTATILPRDSVKNLPYFTQLDLSIGKVFNIGGWRWNGRVEGFNLFNTGTMLEADGDRGTSLSPQTSGLVGTTGSFEQYYEADRAMLGRVVRFSVTARF